MNNDNIIEVSGLIKKFEKRYAELDEMLGLKELEKRAVGKLSGG